MWPNSKSSSWRGAIANHWPWSVNGSADPRIQRVQRRFRESLGQQLNTATTFHAEVPRRSSRGRSAAAYCISNTAFNGATFAIGAALPNFAVNSIYPGWVRTDMGGAGAARSVKEGADTIIWLATDAPQTLTGKFLRDRRPIS